MQICYAGAEIRAVRSPEAMRDAGCQARRPGNTNALLWSADNISIGIINPVTESIFNLFDIKNKSEKLVD